MHECFANYDIRVCRDPYLSSTDESLIAAIGEEKKTLSWYFKYNYRIIK